LIQILFKLFIFVFNLSTFVFFYNKIFYMTFILFFH